MKFRHILQSLGIGYLLAAVFLTVAFAVLGAPFNQEYFVTLVWSGFYGFLFGFLVFAPSYLLIPGSSLFWRYSIGALLGGAFAFAIIYFFLPELAMTFLFGGFAIIMGFFTFLSGSVFHYRNRHGGSERPQQDSDGKPDTVAS